MSLPEDYKAGLNKEQKENYKWFKNQVKDLLNKVEYKYKFLVIRNKAIEGVFDDFSKAAESAMSRVPFKKDFIIQQVIDEDEIISFLSPAM